MKKSIKAFLTTLLFLGMSCFANAQTQEAEAQVLEQLTAAHASGELDNYSTTERVAYLQNIAGENGLSLSNETTLEKSDRRMLRKQLKKELKDLVRNEKADTEANADDRQVLLAILAIFIPPLAVGLYDRGLSTNFWINLILTLLFFLPGLIHALIVILA